MPVSSSIYSNIGQGVTPLEDPQNALLRALKMQSAQEEMQAQRMTRARTEEDYRRGVERSNRLQQLASGDYADDEARADAFIRGGFIDEGQKILKGRSDLNKQNTEIDAKRLEMASKRLDIAGQALGWVKDNPTAENAVMAIEHLGQNGIWNPQQVEKAKADVMANPTPENVARLATMGYQSALSAKDQLPSFVQQSRGGTVATQRINPVTGKVDDVQSATVTQTEAQRLELAQRADEAGKTRAQQAREAAAGRGVQLQIAGMADARARERLEFDKTRTPEEKPLNDTQSKALLFGSRMREAEAVLDALEKTGTTTSVPGSRSGYGIGPVVMAMSSSQKQQLDQAKRNFVNAVLRRESGAVIADSEFDNADKQYFPQIGDSKEVIAQKKRNRQLATQGILLEVPENRRNSLPPTPQMPTADEIRKQADNILRGG